MATINKNFYNIKKNYLFIEMAERTNAFASAHPGVSIFRLGIGNTTEPLPPAIIRGLKTGVSKLAKRETYTGYRDDTGDASLLRKRLADWYAERNVTVDPSEIFISDGAKPDTSNIQSLFSLKNSIAVPDPVYPVYIDSNVITGRITGRIVKGRYSDVLYLSCTKENNFIPHIPEKKVDIVYLCSPNNPTGAVMNKQQLTQFVQYARKHNAVIIFDAAYVMYIKDKTLPLSIYEIKGATECAIEINSFSKWAGFTGVRLGWTVVPKALMIEDTQPGELNAMWARRQTTVFNGASNIAQEGGLAVLSPEGRRECQHIIDYYMENARLIKKTLQEKGLTVYGGDHAPYIWIKTPNNLSSLDFFEKLLNEAHVVGTPGSGFGQEGEGYFRLNAFGHRENIINAMKSIEKNLQL